MSTPKDIDARLDELGKLQRQEAPAFLFTRIEAKIASMEQAVPNKRTAWALGLGVVLILFINTAVILSGANSDNGTRAVAEQFGLMSSNQIYVDHE